MKSTPNKILMNRNDRLIRIFLLSSNLIRERIWEASNLKNNCLKLQTGEQWWKNEKERCFDPSN